MAEQNVQTGVTNNAPAKKEQTPLQKISTLMNGEEAKKKFGEILGSRAPQFITSVMTAVSSNPLLSNATSTSVYGAALMAAAVDLPVVNSLGFSYIVPFNSKKKDPQTGKDVYINEAQYQIGAKGFIQLAMRSGQYLAITVNEVYDGELEVKNRFTEEYLFHERKSDKVVGYLAYFKLVNGMEKFLYMSNEELMKHAGQYSQTFKKFGTGLWKDNFDAMAKKTVIKRLLNKFGILSIDMQNAVLFDQGIKQGDNAEIQYKDNEAQPGKIIDASAQAALFEAAEQVK